MRAIVESIEGEFRRYKGYADKTFEQVSDDQLGQAAPEGNSIVTLVWHVSGNLKSRFTDFLTTDGEKPWRQRDSEFEDRAVGRDELRRKWEEGWAVLFAALSALSDADLARRITIRAEDLAVHAALHRSLAHTASHVGQIVLLAKSMRGADWKTLTMPKRK